MFETQLPHLVTAISQSPGDETHFKSHKIQGTQVVERQGCQQITLTNPVELLPKFFSRRLWIGDRQITVSVPKNRLQG